MVTLREADQLFGFFTHKTGGKTTPIKKFIFSNDNKLSIEVITYGATITSIKVPDAKGVIEDVVLGFSDISGYTCTNNPYLGATIGRVANRIRFGRFDCDGQTIELSKNAGHHHLHGGVIGFDKVLWEPYVNGTKLVLSYHSADLEEGYPGDLIVNVSFELTASSDFCINFQAITSKPTSVNLTNHSYFNLAGHNKGSEEVYKHVICINSDSYTENYEDSIPTGNVIPVAETCFDLRVGKELGTVIDKSTATSGFDHNFCTAGEHGKEPVFVARAHHPTSGRVLEVYSDQPGVQFYTANFFPESLRNFKGGQQDLIAGKGGCSYCKHGAFCFETQNWPDAPNHKNFPKGILHPGEVYSHSVIYKFSVKK